MSNYNDDNIESDNKIHDVININHVQYHLNSYNNINQVNNPLSLDNFTFDKNLEIFCNEIQYTTVNPLIEEDAMILLNDNDYNSTEYQKQQITMNRDNDKVNVIDDDGNNNDDNNISIDFSIDSNHIDINSNYNSNQNSFYNYNSCKYGKDDNNDDNDDNDSQEVEKLMGTASQSYPTQLDSFPIDQTSYDDIFSDSDDNNRENSDEKNSSDDESHEDDDNNIVSKLMEKKLKIKMKQIVRNKKGSKHKDKIRDSDNKYNSDDDDDDDDSSDRTDDDRRKSKQKRRKQESTKGKINKKKTKVKKSTTLNDAVNDNDKNHNIDDADMNNNIDIDHLGNNNNNDDADEVSHNKNKDDEMNKNKKNHIVESEINIIKTLQQEPTESEIRRRELIEIDEEELEERMEELNRATIKVIKHSLGYSKYEQNQKLIQCRMFLKTYLLKKTTNRNGDEKTNYDGVDVNHDDDEDDEDDWIEFIEDSIEKHNNRIYGMNVSPLIDAMAYLRRDVYSDDEKDDKDDINDNFNDESKSSYINNVNLVHDNNRNNNTRGIDNNNNDGMIILSDSEDEEDHDHDVHNTNSNGNYVHAQSNQPIVIETTKAFNNPTTSATSSSSSLQQQLQTKEEIELQKRKEKYYQSINKNNKFKRSARTLLLTTLRQKVHRIAIDNYCNLKKIESEQELKLQLQISEYCRLVIFLE